MTIERREVEPEPVFALALETGLTAYDALYLWLARRLGAGLVTLQTRLQPHAGV